MDRLFLNPKELLVDAVADWLKARLRTTPGGVPSLTHLLVVVPTRQAGRRLRLALAERTGGCLPPLILLPAQVIAPAREPDPAAASPAETLGLLARILLDADLHDFPHLFPEDGHPRQKSFAWALGVARQLADLWGILQENALLMADVAAQIDTLLSGEDLDTEIARWQDLARLETRFFDALRQHGRTPAPLLRKQAAADPALPDGIENIILPALTDAQPALYAALERLQPRAALTVLIHADPSQDDRFDRWGRPEPAQWLADRAPVLPLTDTQLTLAANSSEQARLVADLFAAVPPSDTPPALGLADDTLYSELHAAFLARGLPLHNPADYPLAASSLGRLIRQLEQLCRQPRFTLLAAFLRESDTLRWLESRLPAFSYADTFRALDDLQNRHLPQTLDAAHTFCAQEALDAPDAAQWPRLLAVLDALRDLLDPRGRPHLDHLLDMLQTLFAPRTLDEHTPGDRELAAAATAALALFEALASPLLADALDDTQRAHLFETLLASATYQLEPENPDALLTDGWLELPWSPAAELVITGFNEGSVPDAVVGHAFLPDRLRQALGLTDNARRTARDTCLLDALLASRAPGAVRLTLERLSSRHDVRKPSRLLFLCDEPTLAARAKALFRDAENATPSHPRALPDAWRLALPIPSAPPRRLGVTAFKNYLACPFTFYLRHILALEPHDDRAAELDPLAFGSLCHDALEAFGLSDLKDAADPHAIATFLHAHIWHLMRRRHGENLPAILHLQASAACKRLTFFAERQAALRAEGWQIAHTERDLAMTELGLAIQGRADRIDHHPATGAWRILDYKTWDRPGKNNGLDRFTSSSRRDLETAAQRGIPSFNLEGKPRVWTDLQLPLYLLAAQAGGLIPPRAGPVACGYFTLGETPADTLCQTWDPAPGRDAAIASARWVIRRVTDGIFWPPSPNDAWARDYASLFLDTPEQSLSPAWLADQRQRLARQPIPPGGTP